MWLQCGSQASTRKGALLLLYPVIEQGYAGWILWLVTTT